MMQRMMVKAAVVTAAMTAAAVIEAETAEAAAATKTVMTVMTEQLQHARQTALLAGAKEPCRLMPSLSGRRSMVPGRGSAAEVASYVWLRTRKSQAHARHPIYASPMVASWRRPSCPLRRCVWGQSCQEEHAQSFHQIASPSARRSPLYLERVEVGRESLPNYREHLEFGC